MHLSSGACPPAEEGALVSLSTLHLLVPRPRSQPLRVELRFVLEDGVILLLARIGHGAGPAWLEALQQSRRAQVSLGNVTFEARLLPPDENELQLDEILALFREKYGMQLIKVLYEGSASALTPVALLTDPSSP